MSELSIFGRFLQAPQVGRSDSQERAHVTACFLVPKYEDKRNVVIFLNAFGATATFLRKNYKKGSIAMFDLASITPLPVRSDWIGNLQQASYSAVIQYCK